MIMVVSPPPSSSPTLFISPVTATSALSNATPGSISPLLPASPGERTSKTERRAKNRHDPQTETLAYDPRDDFPPPDEFRRQQEEERQSQACSLHLAAQRGELETITRLLDCESASATDADRQGITALHWAAINGHLAVCSLLIARGAVVDAFGGELVATPLMWAARNAKVYVVDLLIRQGADPDLLDSQGFNTVHLATHSSSALTLAYLLATTAHDQSQIDCPDREGHSALHWACYQGDSLSVDLLLAHRASVSITDVNGMTPLHWAVVKGNAYCLKQIVNAGADVQARTIEGKTPQEMAEELKSTAAWKRALGEAGLDPNGARRHRPLGSGKQMRFGIFVLTIIVLGLAFETFSALPWYSAISLVGAEAYGLHHIITVTILDAKVRSGGRPSEMITQSPYFASIIVASFFWVGYTWATKIVYDFMAAPELDGDEWRRLGGTCVLSKRICRFSTYDTFTLVVAIWASLQLAWTLVLIVSQLWLIGRQMTTLELSNLNRFGYMGGRPGTSMASQSSHHHTAHSSLVEVADHDLSSNPTAVCSHKKRAGRMGFCLKVLGLDRLVPRKKSHHNQPAVNPFNKGIRKNCMDFWTGGNELGVNYLELFEVPEGGFKDSSQRKKMKRDSSYLHHRKMKSFNGGPSTSSPNGYERVAMDMV